MSVFGFFSKKGYGNTGRPKKNDTPNPINPRKYFLTLAHVPAAAVFSTLALCALFRPVRMHPQAMQDIFRTVCEIKSCNAKILKNPNKSAPQILVTLTFMLTPSGLRTTQLCAKHAISRDAMLSQASKTRQGQGMVDLLTQMEHLDRIKFVSELSEFCTALLDLFQYISCAVGIKIGGVCHGAAPARQRAKNLGALTRARASNAMSGTSAKWLTSQGRRMLDNRKKTPFCKADFVKYWSEQAPSYARALVRN